MPEAPPGHRSYTGVIARLFHYAHPSAAAAIALLVLTLLGALLAAALPWPLQYLVDHVLGTKPASPQAARLLAAVGVHSRETAVVALALAALLLNVLKGLLGVVHVRTEVGAGQRSVYELRACLFDHFQRQSLSVRHTQPLGDQLYRLNEDACCVDQLLFSGLLPLVGALATLGVMFAVLWRLDHWLAILSLAVAPFLAACVRYYMGSLETRSRQVREREADVLGLAEQVLAALPVVKAFVREDDEARRFREHGGRALFARLHLTTRQAWFGMILGAITATGTSLILIVGGLHVLRGSLTVGQLLVVLAYLAAVYDPLHAISYTLGQMQSALAGARRVLEVLDTDVEPREEDGRGKPLPPARGHIVFDRVVFGYRPDAPVLREVSFDAPPGSVTALVGATGAGKTTCASLLLRFYDPQEGRVLLDGHDLAGISVTSLRRQVSVVLQEPLLFPVCIAENIRYGRPEATDEEVRAAAVAAHADDFIRELPEGYDTVIAEGGASLSGGERQRISLARAFLKNAPILILDEPTSALDAATEASILESLEQLMQGRTTLVIAHRLSTIRRADQILYLRDGRIVERGTHRELLDREGSYARLHRLYVRAAGTGS